MEGDKKSIKEKFIDIRRVSYVDERYKCKKVWLTFNVSADAS